MSTEAGFWRTGSLKERLPEIIIEHYDPDAIKACCYEMRVGEEVFVSGDDAKKQILKDGETIAIPPGQIALLITYEKIKAPLDALGFLSIKSTVKLRGLINISGFHVDPGFEGRLVFSVYNASMQTIHLGKCSPLFLIWFCSFSGKNDDKYDGNHNKQEHIPDEIITNAASRMPSPFTLETDIRNLRLELKNVEINSTLDRTNLETKLLSEVNKLENLVRILIGLAIALLIFLLKGNSPSDIQPRQEIQANSFEKRGASDIRPPTEIPLPSSQKPVVPVLPP